MYSILIKNGEKSYVYFTNADGTVFAGDTNAVKDKMAELLNDYPLGKIVIVHNVTVTADFTIQDVE